MAIILLCGTLDARLCVQAPALLTGSISTYMVYDICTTRRQKRECEKDTSTVYEIQEHHRGEGGREN